MNYAMRADHALMVKALLESVTGDACRMVSIVHGHQQRYYIERYTGTRWVQA